MMIQPTPFILAQEKLIDSIKKWTYWDFDNLLMINEERNQTTSIRLDENAPDEVKAIYAQWIKNAAEGPYDETDARWL